jgi:hypothetical protein
VDRWWMKMALIILTLSVLYSLITSYWLIVVAFARMEVNFKKLKYRIDTFYLEFLAKLILFLTCGISLYIREKQ